MVTFAPELENGLAFAEYLHVNKMINSFGHSDADYDLAIANIKAGCTTATHLFNAMRGLHHRQPNAVTALLLDENVTPQIIPDGTHLHPAIVRLIYQMKGKNKLALVTDAMPAKGSADGEYQFGGQSVIVRNGEARLPNGALAGSTLTMRDAVLNMMKFTDISFADALHMATCVPAKLLGVFDCKGSIAANKDADVVVLDENYRIVITICRGEICYQRIS
ncbi:MAG: N-acetylglucosamine-6-phosphate deacetylase [Gammaproteobacteria bacterium]|nr:N-acetylglucosamine-6-phosphate deacetylase [Gammaproteobacteria bacterium]